MECYQFGLGLECCFAFIHTVMHIEDTCSRMWLLKRRCQLVDLHANFSGYLDNAVLVDMRSTQLFLHDFSLFVGHFGICKPKSPMRGCFSSWQLRDWLRETTVQQDKSLVVCVKPHAQWLQSPFSHRFVYVLSCVWPDANPSADGTAHPRKRGTLCSVFHPRILFFFAFHLSADPLVVSESNSLCSIPLPTGLRPV